MTDPTLTTALRYADAHADPAGIAETPIPGFVIIRATHPSELQRSILRPVVCLVLQGSKRVMMGTDVYDFAEGDSLLITADVPTLSQITRASPTAPYVSLALDLDPAVIADLAGEIRPAASSDAAPVRVDTTDTEVADAAARLVRLLERPQSVPVLQAQLVREMHYWLMSGRHGDAIRRLGWPDGHVQRIGRAVALLRRAYAHTIPVAQLAEAAGMSVSAFHQHFRAVTSVSPLQFQKQLRLIEARRRMRAEGCSASHAAYAVGYESVPQFTREYGRLFGLPPAQDTKTAQDRARAGA
jgi:AraC-like DNA-binding protein